MADFLIWMTRDWPLLAALFVAALGGAEVERHLRRRLTGGVSGAGTSGTSDGVSAGGRFGSQRPAHLPPPTFDAATQLQVVERATFSSRPLLNKGEQRLLQVLEQACAAEAPTWRVMAQVSLGEILASPDEDAYRAINSKRVDFLLVGPDRHARHAIELQESGHHIGPAATRDAVKKEALRPAGIGYVEVVPGDTPTKARAGGEAGAARRRQPAAEAGRTEPVVTCRASARWPMIS